ncbi:MAG TPA: methyltransferase domain-containing protein [Acidimicrobiales bacterium]|nr:methyltransferase domain-containing protein [Acidimicrobiales bacterium]
MTTRTSGFEGAGGRLAGPVMARMNRDMEREAIDELAPRSDDSVLAIGFGPGVGVAELLTRLPLGAIGGVDPSATMVQQARRRNAAAIDRGQVRLERSTADSVPWPDSTFAGALAVNSLQFWEPLDGSIREVVRVLAPGAHLVTLTHVWAIEKRHPLDEWVERLTEALTRADLTQIVHRAASYRSGDGLVLRAQKPRLCNQIAPRDRPLKR